MPPTRPSFGFRQPAFFVLSLLVFFSPIFHLAAAPTDPLWRKAVDLAGQNRAWVPGLVIVKADVFDGSGDLKDSYEYWSKQTPASDGSVKNETLRSLRNGQPVAPGKKRPRSERSRTMPRFDTHAFLPQEQQRVKATRTGQVRHFEGVSCAGFRFTHKPADSRIALSGTAWLDELTGRPMFVQLAPDPLPPFVRNLLFTVSFPPVTGAEWYPSELRIEGAGGIAFFKRSFNSTLAFSEYWKRQPTASPH